LAFICGIYIFPFPVFGFNLAFGVVAAGLVILLKAAFDLFFGGDGK
jgi:hypothetical protein